MTLRQRYGGPGRRAISRARAFVWVLMWAAACGARTSGP
jgi:hypothetical protein